MINTKRLRCMLGWLGMMLSFIVLALSEAYGYGFPDSISATYYIPTCITPFMIILGSAGLLLISYKGYELIDDIVCTLAGIFGLGICIFSCSSRPGLVGTFQLPSDISGVIHNSCATCFFGLLSINSLFLFTKTSGLVTPNKKKRNVIFRICGIGMILSFIGMIPVKIFNIHGGCWFVEMLALIFFGISWLTKANCYKWLFAD